MALDSLTSGTTIRSGENLRPVPGLGRNELKRLARRFYTATLVSVQRLDDIVPTCEDNDSGITHELRMEKGSVLTYTL